MRRVSALSLVVALAVGWAFLPVGMAASPSPTWSRSFPFVAQAIDVSPDGIVVVAGSTLEGYPGGAVVLRAFDRDGWLAWSSSWKPVGGGARARGVAVTTSQTYLSGVVAPPHGTGGCDEIGSFGWLLQGTDGSGHTGWTRTLRGWRHCRATAGGAVGAGGALEVLGITGYIEGYSDIHGSLIAFDEEGNPVWTNPFEPFPVGGPEGYDADDVRSIAVDPSGRAYVAGWAWRYPKESGADQEAALMALDPRGHRRWVRVFGEPGQPRDDADRGTDVDERGARVVFGAVMMRRDGLSVAKVTVLSTDGAIRWSTGFPAASSNGTTTQVAVGTDGVVYVATRQPRTADRRDLVVRKLATDGDVVWSMWLPTGAGLADLAVGDGGLYVLTHERLWRFPA